MLFVCTVRRSFGRGRHQLVGFHQVAHVDGVHRRFARRRARLLHEARPGRHAPRCHPHRQIHPPHHRLQSVHYGLLCPRPRGHFGTARSVPLSVPWRSCLGYRHAGCLQLSQRRSPEMCGLQTRPPRFLPPSNCHRRGGGGHIVSPPPGRYLV